MGGEADRVCAPREFSVFKCGTVLLYLHKSGHISECTRVNVCLFDYCCLWMVDFNLGDQSY